MNTRIYAHPCDIRYILKFIKKNWPGQKKSGPCATGGRLKGKKNLTLDHIGRGKFEPPFPLMYLEFFKITSTSWNYMWYYNLKKNLFWNLKKKVGPTLIRKRASLNVCAMVSFLFFIHSTCKLFKHNNYSF